MENSKVGYWLQVGANVGILVGLVLVGIQIQTANRITGTELLSANIESTVSRDLALLGENPDAAMRRVLHEPDRATADDYFIADQVYQATLRQMVRARMLASAGLYGTGGEFEFDASGFALVNYQLFACPYGRAWLRLVLTRLPEGGPLFEAAEVMLVLASERPAARTRKAILGYMEES